MNVSRRMVRLLLGTGTAVVGALLASWMLTPHNTLTSDVGYYWAYLDWGKDRGMSDVLREYPTPIVLLMWLSTLVVSTEGGFIALFVSAGVVLVIVGAWAMTRLKHGGEYAAILFVFSFAALGPISLFRFDLLPGVLVGIGAVCLLNGRHGWSALVALATGFKFWPIVAWPVVLGRRLTRVRSAITYVGIGVVLAVVSVLVAGWDRLVSPLTWQTSRGLHVESVLSSWILLGRIARPELWTAELSENNSWDFLGPGVGTTLVLGTLAAVGFVAWLVVIMVRTWRKTAAGGPNQASGHAGTLLMAATSVICWLLVTNKVLSPQYLMWLAPLMTVVIATERVPKWWAGGLVLVCFLTQLAFPLNYSWLYWEEGDWHFLIATWLMLLRNGLLVALAVSSSILAWRFTAQADVATDQAGARENALDHTAEGETAHGEIAERESSEEDRALRDLGANNSDRRLPAQEEVARL